MSSDHPKRHGHWLSVLLLLFVSSSCAYAQNTSTIKSQSTWLVEWQAFDLAKLQMNIYEQSPVYGVHLALNIDGFMASMFQKSTVLETFGTNYNGQPRPQEHHRVSDLGHGTRSSDVAWASPELPPTFDNRPPIEADPVTPVNYSDLSDTIDPLSAWYQIVRQVSTRSDCRASYRVWDGRRRYNLQLTDIGPQSLQADRDWTYSGPAHTCDIGIQRLGGWPIDDDGSTPTFEQGLRIWVAATSEGWQVVRFSAPSPLGEVIGRIY